MIDTLILKLLKENDTTWVNILEQLKVEPIDELDSVVKTGKFSEWIVGILKDNGVW